MSRFIQYFNNNHLGTNVPNNENTISIKFIDMEIVVVK